MTSFALTPAQRRMYDSEREDNFRWILRFSGTRSPYILSQKDLAPQSIISELADIGQFAELAHGKFRPSLIWENLQELSGKGMPLEAYQALVGSTLVREFHGRVASLQGIVVFRPEWRQLVVAISGTSSATQAWLDVRAIKTSYHEPMVDPSGLPGCFVHTGFSMLFDGIRDELLNAVQHGLELHGPVNEVVFTAHSMGAAICHLFVMPFLRKPTEDETPRVIPWGTRLRIVSFGSPRGGNANVASLWRGRVAAYRQEFGDASLQETSVKGYNDGVPSLPPVRMGYRHFSDAPLYLFHGRLYQVPAAEVEHSIFSVEPSAQRDAESPAHPLGGHNYYNGRDMELLQRRIGWTMEAGLGRIASWSEAFLRRVKEEDSRWQV